MKTLPFLNTPLPPQTLNLEQPPLITTLISFIWILCHNESSTHNARSKPFSSNLFFFTSGVVKEKIGAIFPWYLSSSDAGYRQISVKIPILGGKRDSLAEVGEGISYPLTNKRQSTILHQLAASVLGISWSRLIRSVLLVPAPRRRGRLRRILGISNRGHPLMKMWDPGQIHVVLSLLLAEFMSPSPKKNFRPDLARNHVDMHGPVPEVLPCVLLAVIQGWERGGILAGIGVDVGAGWIWWSEVGSWRALSLFRFILLVPRFYLSNLLLFVFEFGRSNLSRLIFSLLWLCFFLCCTLKPDLLYSLADIAFLYCDSVIEYFIPDHLLLTLAFLSFARISSPQFHACEQNNNFNFCGNFNGNFSHRRLKNKEENYSKPIMTPTIIERIASETHQMLSLAPKHRSMTTYEQLRNIEQSLYLNDAAFELGNWSHKSVLISIATPCDLNACSHKDKNYQMNLHSEIASPGTIACILEPLSFLNCFPFYLNSIFDALNLLHGHFIREQQYFQVTDWEYITMLVYIQRNQMDNPSGFQVFLVCDFDRMNIGWIWCFCTMLNPRIITVEIKITNLDLHFYCFYRWCSQVQVARTINGAHIFKKEIKIKSCNKKRSNRKNHYMKPYPLNNLYWNPKFEKIGSWHNLPSLSVTPIYFRSNCSFVCAYMHVKLCIRTPEQNVNTDKCLWTLVFSFKETFFVG